MAVITLDEFKVVAPEVFLKKFQSLWAAQKKELKAIVGKPPDINRVKPEHWKQWKKNQEGVMIILMVGYAMTMLQEQIYDLEQQIDDVNFDDVEREFLREVRERARFAAQRVNQTTRNRLERQFHRTTRRDIETVTRRNSEDTTTRARSQRRDTGSEAQEIGGFDPESLFSRTRSEMIVRTELTAARTASTRSIHSSLVKQGVECHLVWKLRPCDHCEVCPLLDGTPDSFWSRFTNGPPLHPHCCCELQILFGTKLELIRSGQMRRNPSVKGLRAAIQRHGFKV